MFLTLITVVFAVVVILAVVFAVLLEVSIDITKEKEILLWYTEYDEKGNKVRKFIKLYGY